MNLKKSSQRVAQARKLSNAYYTNQFGAHYSCGIAIALTFGLDPKSYRSLRRGGILGYSECGALKAGEMVLGEFLGDPDPTGPVTDELREAVAEYRRRLANAGYRPYHSCHEFTNKFTEFDSDDRRSFCAGLVEFVAGTVAEILAASKVDFTIPEKPIKTPY